MTSTPTLRLDEYGSASLEFFSDAVNAVARASNPILGQIEREHVEVLPTTVNTVGDTVVRLEPILASAGVSFSVSRGIQGDFSDVYVAIFETAEQFVSTIMPGIFGHISDLSDATGNVVMGGDKPIWESILETLETLSISFDEDGNPSLPSIVMHPDMAKTLGDPPVDYQPRSDEIIARRRDEWLATRRTRRLPRLG